MCLSGSGVNFYGGPGESAHKYFVKALENNTQYRVHEFAKQIANRIYECMIFKIANERMLQQEDDYEIIPRYCNDENDGEEEETVGLHSLLEPVAQTHFVIGTMYDTDDSVSHGSKDMSHGRNEKEYVRYVRYG